jgi:hypothetical protein
MLKIEAECFGQPDGSAIVELRNMSQETILALAGIGFLKLVEDRLLEATEESLALNKELKRQQKKKSTKKRKRKNGST